MAESNIQWTDKVWNAITGCSKISTGCLNCYAERMSHRLAGRCGYNKEHPFDINIHTDKIALPSKWKKPCRIFVNSMGDLFHEKVDNQWINLIWNEMFNNPRHTFIILTKRPERLLEWTQIKSRATGWPIDEIWPDWMWVGISAEDQASYDCRKQYLLDTPAAVKIISFEPLLECIDPGPDLVKFQWITVGSETGSRLRPCDPLWIQELWLHAKEAHVPFFYKQGLKSMSDQDGIAYLGIINTRQYPGSVL